MKAIEDRSECEVMETMLKTWTLEQRDKGVGIDGKILISRAQQI